MTLNNIFKLKYVADIIVLSSSNQQTVLPCWQINRYKFRGTKTKTKKNTHVMYFTIQRVMKTEFYVVH